MKKDNIPEYISLPLIFKSSESYDRLVSMPFVKQKNDLIERFAAKFEDYRLDFYCLDNSAREFEEHMRENNMMEDVVYAAIEHVILGMTDEDFKKNVMLRKDYAEIYIPTKDVLREYGELEREIGKDL